MTKDYNKGWRPQTCDAPHHGLGDLLNKAVKKISTSKLNPIHDSGGLCAYEVDKGILVARRYVYGNIVSVANHLLHRAVSKGLWIFLYLDKNETVYKADPSVILENTDFENMKGLEKFNNFKVNLLERLT